MQGMLDARGECIVSCIFERSVNIKILFFTYLRYNNLWHFIQQLLVRTVIQRIISKNVTPNAANLPRKAVAVKSGQLLQVEPVKIN